MLPQPEAFTLCVLSCPGPIPYFEAYREIADSMAAGLRDLGYAAETSTGRFRPGTCHIVFGFQVLPAAAMAQLPPYSICYNLEQISAHEGIKPAYHAQHNHLFWDYSQTNIAALQQHGIPAGICKPIAYHPVLERIPRDQPQDIDVLFYGLVNEERKHILDSIAARGLKLVVLNQTYGADRDACIARAKVVLNLHLYQAREFEMARVSYLLANHKAVVSQCGSDSRIETGLEHGIRFAEAADIAAACEQLVSDTEARLRWQNAGYALIKKRDEKTLMQQALAVMPAGFPLPSLSSKVA